MANLFLCYFYFSLNHSHAPSLLTVNSSARDLAVSEAVKLLANWSVPEGIMATNDNANLDSNKNMGN